jgi:hypothetical protein
VICFLVAEMFKYLSTLRIIGFLDSVSSQKFQIEVIPPPPIYVEIQGMENADPVVGLCCVGS